MARFVLHYGGEAPRPKDVVRRIRAISGASIVDDSDRLLLVDAPEAELRAVLEPHGDWSITPEKKYRVPSTRKRVERPPSDS
jgi:hypothetical protein